MRYLNVGIYLLLLFIILLPFLVFPRIIRIQKVECYSQYGICGEDIFLRINPFLGKSIRDIKKNIAIEFQKDNLIEKYTFTFKFPAILRTDIILRKTKFALYQKDTGEIVTLDKDGNVCQKVEKTNLPKVIISDALPVVGSITDADKLFSLNLIYSLNFLYQADSGRLTSDGFYVNLPQGIEVIFPTQGDAELLLASLKLILSKANRGIMVVDLRFKNPIIR